MQLHFALTATESHTTDSQKALPQVAAILNLGSKAMALTLVVNNVRYPVAGFSQATRPATLRADCAHIDLQRSALHDL